MSGTKLGGLKARDTNIKNDPDFYKKIGAKGGRNGHTGGFAADPELARRAGAIGGKKSKRGKAKKSIDKVMEEHYKKLHDYYEEKYGR